MSSRPALPTAEEIGTLVPIGRIAKETPYSPDFLRQLARSGKIRAFKLNRDWLTTPAAVHDYLKSQTKRHEKALSLLQAAEKAFLAMALIIIVFSATPQARAQGLSNPPPGTTSAILQNFIAGWQRFSAFYGQEFSAVNAKSNQALLLLGQALFGKTSEEYLAETPARIFALAKHPIHPRGLPISTTALATPETSPQVLGLSTPSTPAGAAASQGQIQTLIYQTLQSYLASGKFTGPTGPAGSAGPQGPSGLTAGFSGPNGSVRNTNGQTTSVIGGTPIVSYVPASSNGSYSGGSIAGFTNLSANTLTASGNLTVQGSSSFTSGTFSGALSAAATTLSSLTVSGSTTLSGSTTIAGLTVTGLNPGLTPGSVTFQGASALAQDNSNFFYDLTNHRLGLGTSTPSSTLFVQGSDSTNPFVVASSTGSALFTVTAAGNVGIGTSAPATALEINGTVRGSVQDKGGQVYNVSAYGVLPDGLDHSAQMIALLATVYNAGGGVVYFPPGTYRLDSQIALPNDGGSVPKQPSIRFTGAGPSHSGNTVAAAPNGGTILDLRYGGANGKIVTYGQGYLEIDHLSIIENGSTTVTPFIYTTNTVLHVHDVEAYGYSGKSTTSCDQDFIVLGGTTMTIDGSPNAPFQGYGTVIENNYMNRLRRFVYGRTYVNGVQILNNTVWAQSGGIAAIELDGLGDNDSGNYIAGNLLEMVGYTYAFKLTKAVENTFIGNNLYDAGGTTTAYFRFESTAQYNVVQHGFGNDTVALVSDASGGSNSVLTAHQSQMSTWSQPWTFSNYQVLFANTSNAGPTIQDTLGNQYSTRVTASQWFFSITPSGTTTSEDMVQFLRGSATDKRIELMGTTNSRVEAPSSQLQVYSQAGQALFLGDPSNNLYVLSGTLYSTRSSGTPSIKMTNTGSLQWSGTSSVSAGSDLGVTRTAAGVLEVNNGVSGTWRDLIVRDYSANTTSTSSVLTLQGLSGKDLIEIASSTGSSLFHISQAGNVGIGTTTPTLGPLTMASGAYVSAGGTWTNASDRNLKENFATLTPADILQKIDQLPVTQWDYKSEGLSVDHIGPVAQDFWDAFHLGNSSTSISTIDPAGVALLGIQALDQKIQALQGSLTGNANTTGELTIYNPGNFSGDSVGEAKIFTGHTSIRVTFSQAYQYQPIVTVTAVDFPTYGYVSDVDATGFTVNLPTSVASDVTFNWHSFASPGAQLTISDGRTMPIALVVATSSDGSASSIVSPEPATENTSTPEVSGTSTSTSDSVSTDSGSSTPARAPSASSAATAALGTMQSSEQTTSGQDSTATTTPTSRDLSAQAEVQPTATTTP